MQDDQVMTLDDVLQNEPVQAPEAEVEQVQAQPVETEQGRNFRQLKEAREREEQGRRKAERERDEAVRYIQSLQAQNKPLPNQMPVDEDELSISSDDFVEGKTVKRVYNEVRELKKQLKQYQQQSSESVAEAKLKAVYPDADQILSRDNIDAFSQRYPEMANTIYNSNGDSYSKMVSAYTMIKQMGIVQQPDLYTADKELAQRNAAKPRPLTSIAPQQGDSPMSRANAFANGFEQNSPEAKRLWKEMNELRKGSI